MIALWARRAVALVLAGAVLYGVLAVLDYRPRPGPLLLLCAVVAAVVWLLLDTLDDLGAGWHVDPPDVPRSAGRDHGLAADLRLLEHHLGARLPDAALATRLGLLADARLRRRHGFGRTDPRAADLLGPELAGLLTGPPRRLTPDQIDRHLRTIEEL